MSTSIVLKETINAAPERVFDAFITPEDLLQWHRASPDWTTPHAISDAVVGGRFDIGFGDPEGDNSFDFTGTYTSVNKPTHLAYTLDDGRKVTVNFAPNAAGGTNVTWAFEPEDSFPRDVQEAGWAAQLANLKQYLES